MKNNVLLSLFPGAGLLDRAFEQAGFVVLRGPDLLWGSRIEGFRMVTGVVEGILAGTPCQDFSKARRIAQTGAGVAAIAEFTRVVTEALPDWWLLENVVGVPDVTVRGYAVQRFNLDARDCGSPQRRLRRFQFGYVSGSGLILARECRRHAGGVPCCLASEGKRSNRRTWSEFCQLQGLPPDFSLPGLSVSARYRAVGNGLPLPMGRVVAAAIRRRADTAGARVCACECGRRVFGRQTMASASCRKRMERARRDAAAKLTAGGVTVSGLA